MRHATNGTVGETYHKNMRKSIICFA
ncbi:hypothetical protein RHECNPAF_280063 [Rhizobium etli CNPAF512]|nr:hypothetical protein RHECNPAF_280063 [Rhizobium etli CNPAF512]